MAGMIRRNAGAVSFFSMALPLSFFSQRDKLGAMKIVDKSGVKADRISLVAASFRTFARGFPFAVYPGDLTGRKKNSGSEAPRSRLLSHKRHLPHFCGEAGG
jgi:hypothetical protein